MNLLEGMNQAIGYIEAHLTEKIDYGQLSKISGCSQWYLQRLFISVTDVSISEYIRRRRLTLAAFDLQNTDISVLDAALKYGYQSADAFSRAFKSLHGVTPSQARAQGIPLKAYARITFILSIKGVTAMNYRIEQKDAMKIIGVKNRVSTMNGQQMQEIPKMWDALPAEKLRQVCSLSKDNSLVGLCADMYNDGFDYWIGTLSEENCPPAYEQIEIPPCTWAVFEAVGPMRPLPNAMQEIWGRIFSEWFPNSGYKHASAPEIEYYPEGDAASPSYKCEIWIPIEKIN